MNEFSVNQPVRFETLVSHLSDRDLKANLVTPSPVDRVLSWLPGRRVITFHAVSGQPYQPRLLDALVRMDVLDAASAEALQQDRLRIPYIDQMAISQQPDNVIRDLTKKGYGVWPIMEGVEFAQLDPRTLGLNLTADQRSVLDQAHNMSTKAIGGVWFREDRLVDEKPLLDGDYLPTMPDILLTFRAFKGQTGHYPNSENRWFKTGSHLLVSLARAYDEAFTEPDLRQLLVEVCIQNAEHTAAIRKFLSTPGNFQASDDDDRLVASRNGNQFQVTQYSRKDIIFEQRGYDYLETQLPDHKRVKLEEGVFTLSQFSRGDILYQAPVNTILREIERARSERRNYWEHLFRLPIVLASNKTAIDIGLETDTIDAKHAQGTIANNTLTFDFWPALNQDFRTYTGGLTTVSRVHWPQIFADKDGSSVASRK